MLNGKALSEGESSNSEDDLFRGEVLSASRERLGGPLKTVGVATWALTALLLALFLSIAAVLALGTYTRREAVAGQLVPTTGALRAAPLRSGLVTSVYVREGELVAAGAPLFAVSTETTIGAGGGASAPAGLSVLVGEWAERERAAVEGAAQSQEQVNHQRLAELEARRRAADEERYAIVESLRLQLERERLTRESFEGARDLAGRGLFPIVQLRQREEAWLAAKQSRMALERELARARAARAQMALEEKQVESETQMARADAQRALIQIAERRANSEANAGHVVVAPGAGRVAALQVRPGAIIEHGRAGAIILPEGEALEAELWAPSRSIGFVKVGDEVRLMYDAFPFEKFGVGRGIVRSLSRAATDPHEVAGQSSEPLYRIVVSLDRQEMEGFGQQWPLSPGMRLRADLILEKRSFWEWLMGPVSALGKRG